MAMVFAIKNITPGNHCIIKKNAGGKKMQTTLVSVA